MRNNNNIKAFAAASVCILAVCTAAVIIVNRKASNPSDTENTASVQNTSSLTSSQTSADSSAADDADVLYDTTPVSQAYLSGDTSGLDSFQLKIYQKAVQVIEENISSEMTDYEKELAIHDYLILNVSYDEQMLGVFETHEENAENPYGALYDGKAICSGYTTSFQMFMDMLEIPCRSMKAIDADGEDHAWNMVQIDGEWYYVDVTWDDPVPDREGLVRNKYFNVTEEYMAFKHEWHTDDLPEADSYENSYIAHNLYFIDDFEKMGEYMTSYIDNGRENIYFEFDKSLVPEFSETDRVDDFYSISQTDKKLSDYLHDFVKDNSGVSIACQRVKYEDRIVLGVYLSK